MSRSVLLVEPDLDALAALASSLRSRGLNVALADSGTGLLDRLRSLVPDAVLISDALSDAIEVASRVRADRSLSDIQCFLLTDTEPDRATDVPHLFRDDVDLIVKRLYALPSRPPPTVAHRDDFRGDLDKLGVADLLQLLSMNRRTGSLSLSVPSGAGEVRLIDGEVVDVVFRRLEAEKALFRLLAETEGRFAFASGLPAPVRRISTPTTILLMEGMRVVDEVRRHRDALAAEGDALIATSRPREEASDTERRVMLTLLAPHTIDELLDAIPDADHEILVALDEVLACQKVRRIPKGAVRAQLAQAEQLSVLGALANRLRARGYSGPARIVVAAPPGRLAALAHSLRRISEAVAPADVTPTLPLPHQMALLRLGEGAELSMIGLPAAEDYSPMWGLALGGSAVAVRIGESGTEALAEACAVAGVPLLDAEVLVGQIEEADPVQVAALIRATLDALSAG